MQPIPSSPVKTISVDATQAQPATQQAPAPKDTFAPAQSKGLEAPKSPVAAEATQTQDAYPHWHAFESNCQAAYHSAVSKVEDTAQTVKKEVVYDVGVVKEAFESLGETIMAHARALVDSLKDHHLQQAPVKDA